MKTTAWLLILNALFQCVFFVGCSGVRHRTAPASATMSAPGVAVSQVGEAAAPAKIESRTRKTSIPLPAGTELVPDLRTGGFSYRLAADSLAFSEVSETQAAGPSSFAPDAPPTPQELALGFGLRGAWVVGGVLLLAGLALFYFGHGKAGGICLIGAAAVPAVAQFLGSRAGQITAACIVCVGGSLVVAWYLMEWRKKKAAEQAAAVGRVIPDRPTP